MMKFIRYVFSLTVGLLAACSQSEIPPMPESTEVPVTIRTFADAGNDTKLLNDSEASVRSVRIYIFDSGKLDRMQFFGEDAVVAGMKMRARAADGKTFCAVVNEPEALTETLDRVSTPDELKAVMFSLSEYMSLNRSVGEADVPGTDRAYCLPLYGQSDGVTVSSDGPNVVSLNIYRAVARVDVYLRAEASAYVECAVTPETTLTIEQGADRGYFSSSMPNTTAGATRILTRPERLTLLRATDAANKSDYKRIYSYYLPAQQFAQAEDRIHMTFDKLDWEGNKSSYPTFRMGDLIVGYDNTIQRNTIYKIYCTLSQVAFRVDTALHIEDWDVKHQHGDL